MIRKKPTRTEILTQGRIKAIDRNRARSSQAQRRVEAAITEMERTGRQLTNAAIQTLADVHENWLYEHADVKAHADRVRAQILSTRQDHGGGRADGTGGAAEDRERAAAGAEQDAGQPVTRRPASTRTGPGGRDGRDDQLGRTRSHRLLARPHLRIRSRQPQTKAGTQHGSHRGPATAARPLGDAGRLGGRRAARCGIRQGRRLDTCPLIPTVLVGPTRRSGFWGSSQHVWSATAGGSLRELPGGRFLCAGWRGVGDQEIPPGCDHAIPPVLALWLMLLRVGGGLGDGASGPFVGSVAGAVHEDLVAGVDEPVEQGLGDDGVREQRVPVGRVAVRGGDQRSAGLGGFADQLVEVVGLLRGVLAYREVVQDQHVWSGKVGEAFGPGAVGVAAGEVGQDTAGFVEADLGALPDGEVPERLCHMGFPDTDGAVQENGFSAVEPAEGGEVTDLRRGEFGGGMEVEAFQGGLPVRDETVDFLAGLLAAERGRRGTRADTRALSCRDQAVLVLRWFLDGTRMSQLARDNAIGRSTGYDYLHEGIDVLAVRAPSLPGALLAAKAAGYSHVNIDGVLIETDRVSTPGPTPGVDLWWSGKHHDHGGNVQVLTVPDGWPIWTSEVRPGREHDTTAARTHAEILPALAEAAGELRSLGDLGYEGEATSSPWRSRNPRTVP
jgi:DDE superfamily endonuclease